MTTAFDVFAVSLAARWLYLLMMWADMRDRARYLRRLARAKHHDRLRSRGAVGFGTPDGTVSQRLSGTGAPVEDAPSVPGLVGAAILLAAPTRTRVCFNHHRAPVGAGVSRPSRPPASTSAGAGAAPPASTAPAGPKTTTEGTRHG